MRSAFNVLPVILGTFILLTFSSSGCKEKATAGIDTASEKKLIAATLDSFNRAAARADYDKYFSYYADGAIFTGTDATERWDKKSFMVWAKPYFDRGRAWNFTAIERNIYFDKRGTVAWFDELLNTQMKICRGSGVMVKTGADWKLQQYILSATVPNTVLDTVVIMKTPIEDSIIRTLISNSDK